MLPISDAINTLNLQLPHTLPDHSVIISEFDLFSFISQSVPSCNDQSSGKKCKKNIRKIDGKFMCSTECIQLINCTIEKIEANVKCQTEIDYIYSNVKSIFVSEIDKLPEIQTASSKHGKRALRKAAPFWNPGGIESQKTNKLFFVLLIFVVHLILLTMFCCLIRFLVNLALLVKCTIRCSLCTGILRPELF